MRLIAKQARRAATSGAVLALAALLASCGGGGSTSSNFRPDRIIAFGDETSSIVDIDGNGNGRKYSVNGTVSTSDTTIDCRNRLMWVQALSQAFGTFVFPTCNPAGSAVFDPPNRIRAAFGARAADLSSQIDAQLVESNFRDGDLVSVLVGANDVLAQYEQYPTLSEPEITANVDAAGAEVGRQVNRLAAAGAKVIVATIPDVSLSPYAIAQRAAHIDTDRQRLIQRLVDAFNVSLKLAIDNDGHKIGLVLLDEAVRQVEKFPGTRNIVNSTDAVCDLTRSQLTPPSVLDCTEFTLIPDGAGDTYLWADDRHLSSGGQRILGQLAVDRALNNPF